MGFTKLKDRIDKLPLILAGPIVRRVEPVVASVWVALRRRRKVRLEIYDASGALVGKGERETLAVGTNLHIACVTGIAFSSFSAGTTYQYNLFFDHVGAGDSISDGANLFGAQIVSASNVQAVAADEARVKLTYATDGGPARPSFVLPPSSLDQLRLLHGSCRKVSGPHSDALEAADAILREAFKTSNKQRPHMLFLTGDNIYNDGTERELFEVILDAVPLLLGWDEEMAGSGRLSKMDDIRFGDALDGAGLSNTGKYYHLFGLGETITLHLLEFAEVLWPNDLDYQRRTFDFQGTLPAVRRAFANLATYMIFDDHEFSNSWNLSADWVESVLNKDMGRRVYQNALAAYTLCQGWGNTPNRFDFGAGKELLDAIAAWSAAEIGGTSSPSQPLERIAKSTGIPSHDQFRATRDWSKFHGQDVVRWDYNVPCPGLNIEVLDTYMWRSYPGSMSRSIILPKNALDQQLDQAPANTECSLIVVSNVAIELPGLRDQWTWLQELGWGLLTVLAGVILFPVWLAINILQFLIGRFFPHGTASLPSAHSILRFLWPIYREEYFVKYEAQTEGFELLMSHAIHRSPQQIVGGNRQGRVVFLSGDAHRSSCMRMHYWSRVPFGLTADPLEGVIAQFIGSPCKWVNPNAYTVKDTAEHHWAGWRDEPNLTWKTPPKKSPWPFKDSPWMVEYTPGANQPIMKPDPEWRYSLTVVAPNLEPSVPLEIPDRPNPTLADQIAEMKLVSNNLLTQIEKSPVLKINNLADVSFDWKPGKRAVVQDVWWRARPAVDLKWSVSRFVVPMEPPPPPQLPK